MEENSLLQELVSVVKSLEAAQLEPRALSEAESQALDRTRDPRTPVVAWAGKNATAGERLQLRSLAHRIWAALGHSSTEPLQGAKCRSLACELLEEGLEESAASAGSSDAALLASHWALTGRAWALAKEDAVALQCFGRASKSAAGTKNAEADVQARLWAAEVLFRRGDYAESLEELAQAKGQLRQLPPQMLDNLLCVCYTQASSHRSAQNFPQAVELLNLALSAGNMPAATKCKLLRLLALCHVPELDVALAHARQALALAGCSKDRVAAQEVLLELLQSRECNAQKEEVRSLALSLVREPESSVALCVATCQVLLDYGMHQDAQQLSASLRSRPGLGEEQRRELLLQTLQMAAEAVIQSKAEAEQHLVGAVANVETCAELCLPGGRLLSGLASKLWSGRPDDAANWASRAAQMMSKSNEAGDEAADCWFDAGRRFRQLGKLPEAQRCAREAKGHVEAQLLLLELACEAGKDCAEGWTCMEQLRQMDLTLAQASRAAQAARQQPHEDLALAALELFVAASESQADLTSLAVAAHLVKRHTELQRPTEELLQTLAAARRLGAQCRRGLAAELSSAGLAEPEPRPGLAALRQLVACAWGRGEELGRNLQWQQAAAMFEAGHQVLEVIDMDSQGLDPARLREFVDARAWCMIQDAAARVEQAKDRAGGQLKEALELLEKAHRLCKQSRQLQSQGAFAEAPCSSSTWCHRRFLTLVLQEFEVRCLIGEPEQQLRRFVDTASAESELGVKSLLAMSKLAASASCRRLAIHCLQRYLKTFIGASDADFKELLAAYREMLALQASRNESLVVFDGILNLLAGVNVSSDAKFPKEEIKWLVATAWNTGTHFFRLQQYRWAEKWMSKGMALAKLCPGSFSSEKMTEGYIACLNHCA
ncbi:unnamed protein product [Effrenium voratum]|uniref:Protein ZIP4 homolog n=1 Tax=Effrenium voratum TaxID=2562239 RepID=A0AA36N2K1_9DINO|nr:unnamed protein product [Effrenium voratum]